MLSNSASLQRADFLRIRARSKAFTLTEIALVLGIVGTILAALWAAYATLQENSRVNRTSEIMAGLAQAIRSTYQNQLPPSMPAASNSLRVTQVLNTMGVFPKDLQFFDLADINDDYLLTPARSRLQVSLARPAVLFNHGPGFIIDLYGMTVSQCIKLAQDIVQNGDSSVSWLRINSTPDFNMRSSRPNESVVATKCNQNEQAHLGVGYTFATP